MKCRAYRFKHVLYGICKGSGFRVQNLGFRVHGLGFWVLGLGFRVQGS